jgi:hypothetical protein
MSRDLILIIAILASWIILNKWILPALGIPTCMSGGCCGTSACAVPDQTPIEEAGTTETGKSSESSHSVVTETQ